MVLKLDSIAGTSVGIAVVEGGAINVDDDAIVVEVVVGVDVVVEFAIVGTRIAVDFGTTVSLTVVDAGDEAVEHSVLVRHDVYGRYLSKGLHRCGEHGEVRSEEL